MSRLLKVSDLFVNLLKSPALAGGLAVVAFFVSLFSVYLNVRANDPKDVKVYSGGVGCGYTDRPDHQLFAQSFVIFNPGSQAAVVILENTKITFGTYESPKPLNNLGVIDVLSYNGIKTWYQENVRIAKNVNGGDILLQKDSSEPSESYRIPPHDSVELSPVYWVQMDDALKSTSADIFLRLKQINQDGSTIVTQNFAIDIKTLQRAGVPPVDVSNPATAGGFCGQLLLHEDEPKPDGGIYQSGPPSYN